MDSNATDLVGRPRPPPPEIHIDSNRGKPIGSLNLVLAQQTVPVDEERMGCMSPQIKVMFDLAVWQINHRADSELAPLGWVAFGNPNELPGNFVATGHA